MRSPALEFVIPGDLRSASGGYVYDRAVAAGLRMLGWEVAIHALDGSFPQPSSEALRHAKRTFARLPDGARVLVDGLALGAMPDLVELHSQRLQLVALIHMPLASELGMDAAVVRQLLQQELRALTAVRHIIVTSRVTEQTLKSWGIRPSLLSVVEPGVPEVNAVAIRNDEPGSETSKLPTVQLLCVATVHQGKGHELLLDALAPLAHLPWRLVCVGNLSRSPATVQRLRNQLQRLGLSDRVALIAEVPHSQLGKFYTAADVFVLPTLRETYCMAVAEALAHGLPVVSTRTGAIPELVGQSAGFLVEPNDPIALRTILERILTDGALRSSLASAALTQGARLTRWPQACARIAQILESLTGPHLGPDSTSATARAP